MITDAQLGQLKSLHAKGVPILAELGGLIKTFELDQLAHKLRGTDKIKLDLARSGGVTDTVAATKINSVFAYHDSVPGKRLKTLTHIPSGLALIIGTRTVVLHAVSEVRKLPEDVLEKLAQPHALRLNPELRDQMQKIVKDAKTLA